MLKLKKQHPCGGWLWEIQRTGAEIALKCLTCGRFQSMPRRKLEKAVKSIEKTVNKSDPAIRHMGSKDDG